MLNTGIHTLCAQKTLCAFVSVHVCLRLTLCAFVSLSFRLRFSLSSLIPCFRFAQFSLSVDISGYCLGRYGFESAFPCFQTSRMIGACLLPLFREWNWRFDVIGGVLYFLLAVSAFPVCGIYHQFEGLSALDTLKQVRVPQCYTNVTLMPPLSPLVLYKCHTCASSVSLSVTQTSHLRLLCCP
jgi:hypothetical protein